MNDYKLLAVRYLKMNEKRSLITIGGTAFMVLILFATLNLAWGALLAHRDTIREEADYEIILYTETKEQIDAIIADSRVKSAYVGNYYEYRYGEGTLHENALYINVTNPYRINSIENELENRYGVTGSVHNELAWTYLQGSDGSELVVYILFILVIVYIMTIFGVGIIRNSIQLCMLENIKDYGNMRCIGISKGQLRAIIFLQGFLLESIGIVIGTILGTIASIIGAAVIKATFHVSIQGGFHFLPFLAVYVAYLFDLFFAMNENAKLVTNMTPVSAIRGEYRIKKEKIKLRKNNIFKLIFGIDGDYAYKNVMRNPGRFYRTVGALAFGAAALMVIVGVESDTIKVKSRELAKYNYYQFYFVNDLEVDETIDQVESGMPPVDLLTKFSNSREVGEVKQFFSIIGMTASPDTIFNHLTQEYMEEVYEGRSMVKRYQNYQKKTEEELTNSTDWYTKLMNGVYCIGYDEDELKQYDKVLEAGTTNLSENGIILVNGATLRVDDYGDITNETKYVTLTDYQVGDTIELVDFKELNRRYLDAIAEINEQYAGLSVNDVDYDERYEQRGAIRGQVLRKCMQEMLDEGKTVTYTIEGIVSEDVKVAPDQYMNLYPMRIIMRKDSFCELSGLDGSRPTGMLYHFDKYPTSMNYFNAFVEWVNFTLMMSDEDIEAGNIADVSTFVQVYIDVQMFEKTIQVIGIIVGIVLIMVILNLINTSSSNLYLRRKEFAQLRVIGVSKKHLIKMVVLEGIITSIVANVVGIIIGTLLRLALAPATKIMFGMPFSFPWVAMIVAVVFTTAILCATVYFPIRSLPNSMADDLKTGGD